MDYREEAFPDNTLRPWYVTCCCMLCGTCTELAPSVFSYNDCEDHSRVEKQPETPTELDNAKTALDACPMQAIVCITLT